MENIQELLDKTAASFRTKTDGGTPASYIPELACVDPGLFALSVTTLEGQTFSSGGSGHFFSMQSISKAAALAFALESFGDDAVFSKIGKKPCSEPFNSIMHLEITSSIPLNPFINAGAIVLSSLLHNAFQSAAIDEALSFFARLMGRSNPASVRVNEPIYRSEKGTADRNRALAYYLRTVGTFTGDVEEILDLYFKLCSIEVTTIDLSILGATLAAGGRNPVTGDEVLRLDTAYTLIGLMSACGLYDESAEFAVTVGIPAKSGVCGGILCAVPGRMGLAVFSPPLNKNGNSVAGIHALSALSRELKLRGI